MQNLTPYIMLVEKAKAAARKIGAALEEKILTPLEVEFAALAELVAAAHTIVDDILAQVGLAYERLPKLTDSPPASVVRRLCEEGPGLIDALARAIVSWNLAVADLAPGASHSTATLAAARILASMSGVPGLEYEIERLEAMYRQLHAPAGPRPNPIATTGVSKGEAAILQQLHRLEVDLTAIKKHFSIG